MHDNATSLWLTLELDPGTAAFLGLPARLPIPESHAASVLGPARPPLAALGRALEAAMDQDPDLASDPAFVRFRRRWPRYADLERYLRIGNATFAEQLARRLCADDPSDAPARLALALVTAMAGEWDASLGWLGPLRERMPDHPATRLHWALSLAGAGRPAESLVELELLKKSRWQSLARLWSYEIRTSPLESLPERVRAGLRARLPMDAPESAGEAGLLGLFPENPEVLFLKSFDARFAPTVSACEHHLRSALAVDPGHEGATAGLGRVLRTTGRAPEARAVLEEFLARHPGESEVFAELGATLEYLGLSARAGDAYREAFSPPWSARSAHALLASGMGLLRLGEREALRSRLEQALTALPAEPALFDLKSRLLAASHGAEAAERALREGVKACGPRPTLLYSLGDLLRRMDRRHEAEGLMKALIKRHPDAPWGYRGLGDLAMESDSRSALEHYARAVERDPVTPIPGVDYLLGLRALREGKPAEARERLERATGYDPSNPRFWCDLGAAYFHEQRAGDAIRATERALALRPDQPGFLHNLSVYHREQFRRRPWRFPLGLWRAWRLHRRSGRGEETHWRRHLWHPPAPPGRGASESATEAPPDAGPGPGTSR